MKTFILLLLLCCQAAHSQNFAVLLAGDNPEAPAGMPTNWPSIVQPIGTAAELPQGYVAPWRFASKEQVEQWKAMHAAEIEAWNAAREAAATAPKRDRDALIKQAIADLKLIRDSSGTLTAAQLSNAVRSISRTLLALLEELGI